MPSLTEDVNVDELRRRARRRLVGAIVLALAAAVIVPMLLESDPRPLGEDVAVKIPPVDDGKFVNRLNDPATKTDKAPPARTPEAKDTRGTVAPRDAKDGQPASDTQAAKAADAAKSKYDTRLADKDAASTETKGASAKVEAPPAAPSSATPAPAAPATSAPSVGSPPVASAPSNPPALAPPASAPSAAKGAAPSGNAVPSANAANGNGTFAVQLAAFSDDKGANALAGRLKRAGYSAYTEPLKTSKGTLWRVRVGPYASRDAANAARDKLKSEGQNGIVAPAH